MVTTVPIALMLLRILDRAAVVPGATRLGNRTPESAATGFDPAPVSKEPIEDMRPSSLEEFQYRHRRRPARPSLPRRSRPVTRQRGIGRCEYLIRVVHQIGDHLHHRHTIDIVCAADRAAHQLRHDEGDGQAARARARGRLRRDRTRSIDKGRRLCSGSVTRANISRLSMRRAQADRTRPTADGRNRLTVSACTVAPRGEGVADQPD